MSPVSYTPEPWRSNIFGIYGDCVRDEIMVAHVGVSADRRILTDENIANAARIVACVNACAGMTDPAKEIAELREIAFMYKELCK